MCYSCVLSAVVKGDVRSIDVRCFHSDLALWQHADCAISYNGTTRTGLDAHREHLERDVRKRVGAAVADPDWTSEQLPLTWAPNTHSLARRPRRRKAAAAQLAVRSGQQQQQQRLQVRAAAAGLRRGTAVDQPPPAAAAITSGPAATSTSAVAAEDGAAAAAAPAAPSEAGSSPADAPAAMAAMADDDEGTGRRRVSQASERPTSRVAQLSAPKRRISQADQHLHAWEVRSRLPDHRHLPPDDARRRVADPAAAGDAAARALPHGTATTAGSSGSSGGGGGGSGGSGTTGGTAFSSAAFAAHKGRGGRGALFRSDSHLFKPLAKLYVHLQEDHQRGTPGEQQSSSEVRI